jgi:hypothetical protein
MVTHRRAGGNSWRRPEIRQKFRKFGGLPQWVRLRAAVDGPAGALFNHQTGSGSAMNSEIRPLEAIKRSPFHPATPGTSPPLPPPRFADMESHGRMDHPKPWLTANGKFSITGLEPTCRRSRSGRQFTAVASRTAGNFRISCACAPEAEALVSTAGAGAGFLARLPGGRPRPRFGTAGARVVAAGTQAKVAERASGSPGPPKSCTRRTDGAPRSATRTITSAIRTSPVSGAPGRSHRGRVLTPRSPGARTLT